MSLPIPPGKTRLLLVEGVTDKEFFIQLGFHLGFTKDTPLQILTYSGKDNLKELLALVQADMESFVYVTHVGIIRDADFSGGAFQSVQSALQSANQENPDRKQYPIPNTPLTFAAGDVQVGIFVMPDAQSDGMLESLLLRSLGKDAIMACVEQYFECVEGTDIELKPEPLPKALMRVYMAALYQGKIRTYIEGKNIDFETPRDDRDKSYLSDIYTMGWWSWKHEAFKEIIDFVQHLTQ